MLCPLGLQICRPGTRYSKKIPNISITMPFNFCHSCTKVFSETIFSHGTITDHHIFIPDFLVAVDERCYLCRRAYLSLSSEQQMLLRSLVDDAMLRHALPEDASVNNKSAGVHREEPLTKIEISVYSLFRNNPRTRRVEHLEKNTKIIVSIIINPEYWHSSYLMALNVSEKYPICTISLYPSSSK